MRLLLDTHTLLWWLDGDRRLSTRSRALIGDEQVGVLVSAASAWEITTKWRLGKLPGAEQVAADVAGAVASQGFTPLPISLDHAERAGRLVTDHRDPFDRMLVAQSQLERLPILTGDPLIAQYAVTVIW